MKTQQQIEFYAFKTGYRLGRADHRVGIVDPSPKYLETKFEEYMKEAFQLELPLG